MAGGINGSWAKVVENIEAISKLTYVTVGVVLTPENIDACKTDSFLAFLPFTITLILAGSWYDKYYFINYF